jgi:hypothetical protein
VATCKHWLLIGQTEGRIQAHSGAGSICWYDITAQLQDHETRWFASPVDGEVRAEASRREFIQTMSKTFAQLSTGLTIFDHKRTLIHFNPALLDISGLDFESLSLKPDLATFLDTLRGKGFCPNPKIITIGATRWPSSNPPLKKGATAMSGNQETESPIAFRENHIRTVQLRFCSKTSVPKPRTPAKPVRSSAFWKTHSMQSPLLA